MARSSPLAGHGVLVTRPRHQADGLVRALRVLGGEPLLCPTIAIVPMPVTKALRDRFLRLRRGDCLIFISPNAVEFGMALLESIQGVPAGVAVAVVGRATARSLGERGIGDVIVPARGADSEALLALPELQQMAGRNVLIVRGVGGRELLGETLRDRGARVAYAEVYRRAIPETQTGRLGAWLAGGQVDIVTATSPAGLENLVTMAGPEGRGVLLGLPLVVVSERMLQLAKTLGFHGPVRVAEGAGDDAVSRAAVALAS